MNTGGFFFSLLVGLPGGILIIMGMFMFQAVIGLLLPAPAWTLLPFLCLASLLVGMLARLMQPYHGLASALAAGIVAAVLLLLLGLSRSPSIAGSPVWGPVGMLAAVGFCLLGARTLPRLKRRAQ